MGHAPTNPLLPQRISALLMLSRRTLLQKLPMMAPSIPVTKNWFICLHGKVMMPIHLLLKNNPEKKAKKCFCCYQLSSIWAFH